MLKLLQIDSCLGVGSTGRITENIGKLARSEGWDTYIMHGARYTGKSEMISLPIVSRLQEYMHISGSILFDKHGLFSTSETKRAIQLIRQINPDIIQLHCIHGYYLNYKVLFVFLAELNIPIVWTFHDCWAFTGHCGHFVHANCNKWKSGCYSCPLLGDYPKSLYFDNSQKTWLLKKDLFSRLKNITIITVSQWLDDITSESFFSKKAHFCIYNGIDTKVFVSKSTNLREKYNLKKKIVLVAAATAWNNAKGLNDYFELCEKLPSECKLVLIGLSENQIKSLTKNIIGLPKTNNTNDLAEWYSEADVVMNLSYAETFGLTTVEGMACGTPGIVYNCTASPELITPETGFIIEPGDIDGILNAIETIKSKGKQFYSEACRIRAVSYFDQNKQFSEYIKLYKDLLNIS